ncbi:hypothetical protein O1611_g10511 [Lasiodiplodia mahajangana]|uniref:Uncharacterized protein n=1 Tax=Lasiodiplodia mahajangana TaxID=1108764 RepID=A0ACC2IXC8_9PEZI|nr:hypothetical protein O1611_g10511 [Lasiodiplodia mahajangana]
MRVRPWRSGLSSLIACSLKGQNDASQNSSSAVASRLGVEERLQRHEDALGEIKTMIQALGSKRHNSSRSPRPRADPDGQDDSAPAAGHESSDPEYLLNPVDRGSKSAPIVVLREISQHVTLGYRRMIGHGDPDLVQLQLLDEQTASELIELFIKYQGHTLLVRSYDELRHCGDTRHVSAFLHSVCCMIGIVYRDDICGTTLHRQIYEQVRITLGQAVLCSPLDLDDLNAMFIMSNNANTPSSQGVEYIDSWLLTGYCAKQAMLSIYFTQIVNRLKKGNSTIEDHRAMHLWSTICLHHLHWAATTGRASIIPKGYINQCNVCDDAGRDASRGDYAIFGPAPKDTPGIIPSSLLSTDNTPVAGPASIGSKMDDRTPISAECHDVNWVESETVRDGAAHSSEIREACPGNLPRDALVPYGQRAYMHLPLSWVLRTRTRSLQCLAVADPGRGRATPNHAPR